MKITDYLKSKNYSALSFVRDDDKIKRLEQKNDSLNMKNLLLSIGTILSGALLGLLGTWIIPSVFLIWAAKICLVMGVATTIIYSAISIIMMNKIKELKNGPKITASDCMALLELYNKPDTMREFIKDLIDNNEGLGYLKDPQTYSRIIEKLENREKWTKTHFIVEMDEFIKKYVEQSRIVKKERDKLDNFLVGAVSEVKLIDAVETEYEEIEPNSGNVREARTGKLQYLYHK